MMARGGQRDQWQWQRLLLVAEVKLAAVVAVEHLLLQEVVDHRAHKCPYICGVCATYASAILDDVHIKLAASSIDDAHCADSNEPDARIITFCHFYFSLGFTVPFSKFFRKVFYAMECAPSQLRRYEKYAQVRVCKDKLFDSLNQGDHIWHVDVLEVSGMWEGKVSDAPLVLITYCDENDICKKLDLGPNMAKGCRVLNIRATRC
ncbi:unnamed protein product [Prunus armeniaca]